MQRTPEEEIEAVIAAADDDDSAPTPESSLGILKYRAANDNARRAWLRWVWLILALSVPLSLAVALLRRTFD
jgi:hypothetical protein